MPKFMLQVVLHESQTAAAYDGLTAGMAKHGFVRDLPGRKASYRLPAGCYWYEGSETADSLRLTAASTVEKMGKKFGIAVIRASGWSVMGLKKVHAASRD
jgi:hypothetical protein